MDVPSRRAVFSLLSAFLLMTGCASKDANMVSDNGSVSPCPNGLTLACYEYMGKPTRCYCSTRDGLREILEPREPY